MAEKMELGFPKTSISDLKEQAARKILRNVRSQGHPYVELRENGRNFVYFCTLCLKSCYGDDVLFQHLNGSFHRKRLSTAEITLLRPNPWPFNDGLVFFDTSTENDKGLETRDANRSRLLKLSDSGSNLAIMRVDEAVPTNVQPSLADNTPDDDCALVIPHLMIGEETLDVKVRDAGLGKIAARFIEKGNVLSGIRRIWCEWLGKKNNGQQDDVKVPEHDYALVIFSYNCDLGRLFEEEVKSLPPPPSPTEPESDGDKSRERKKSLSDHVGVGYSMRNQKDSSPKGPLTSTDATSRLALDQYDDQHLLTRLIANKTARKELRRQKRLAAEKMCNICQQKMLPGKDVAALLNSKTGRLACNTRNETGAFHVFHMSCALHWILICESSIITNRLVLPKVRQGVKRKTVDSGRKTGKGNDMEAAKPDIKSVFCPECQGTGMVTDEATVEYPPFSLSEMFSLRMKAVDGRNNWITSPEVLQNCSIGFHFPPQSEEMIQEKVEPIKLLRFYRADDVQSGP